MGTDTGEARGLARGVVGSARTIAFGTSIVSPSASAATVLVLLVTYAGFASPLVVLITFEAATALGEEARTAAAPCRRASSASSSSRDFSTCWWSARRPAVFQALGRRAAPDESS